MNKRQIIWASVCLLVILTFYQLIPIDTYEEHDMLFSFVGGILLFITLFFALGDFTSLEEITSKIPANTPENGLRKLSPFAIFPAFIFLFVLVFHQSSRKKEEIAQHGVLTKGTVIGGEATETTRRFQTNTSYSLIIAYRDSLGVQHKIDQSVNSSEFNDVYKGMRVDVVYSRNLPGLASALFSVKELSKYVKIPEGTININNLIAILNGSVKKDSIVRYLNSINYEWQNKKNGLFVNEKLDLAVNVFLESNQLAYLEQSNLFSGTESDFETTLTDFGFKKKSVSVEGQADETLYYNDEYIISKERSVEKNNSNDLFSSTVSMIYRVLPRKGSID